MKTLYKSRTDAKICGVCGGIAEYLNVDATLVRLAMAALVFCADAGLIIYIIAALCMNKAPETEIVE